MSNYNKLYKRSRRNILLSDSFYNNTHTESSINNSSDSTNTRSINNIDDCNNSSDNNTDFSYSHIYSSNSSIDSEQCEITNDDEYTNNNKFRSELASLVIQHNISHIFCDSLLKLLKSNGHSELPSTTRTLIQTKYNRNITVVSGQKYYYFGF